MTSEAIGVPLGRSDKAGGSSRSGTSRAAQPAGRGGDSRLAAEARLTAELAEERRVAVELQRAILPLHDEAFELPGLRTMVRYLPASKAGRVGGDWYITADMPGGHVLIALGDVAGHGLAAAAGMARLRGALAGLAITGSPPERLVGWLNDLVHHVGPEHTASVVAGYFDPPSRTLTWAQAGHPPPVLVRGSWARPLDPPEGILLGAAQGDYAAAVLALAPGDLLLLYSDGLIERRDRSVEEGLATLSAAVRGITDPEHAIDAAVRALGSADPEDDTCLVALQVL
ncbi:MAG TPA: PP2C family protein-serine/threonine phosphatase [Streptosporangiaceae bacterium]|jgi:serine phosphatase RsbU (regulator of sigma subunit)